MNWTDRSAEVRTARARVRSELYDGVTTLKELLNDPPPCIVDVTLWEVICWQYSYRSPGRDQRLGAEALSARVNLLCPVGRAPVISRRWVAEHGTHWAPGRRQARAGATA